MVKTGHFEASEKRSPVFGATGDRKPITEPLRIFVERLQLRIHNVIGAFPLYCHVAGMHFAAAAPANNFASPSRKCSSVKFGAAGHPNPSQNVGEFRLGGHHPVNWLNDMSTDLTKLRLSSFCDRRFSHNP